MSWALISMEDLERIVLFVGDHGPIPFWGPRSNSLFVFYPEYLLGFLHNLLAFNGLHAIVAVRGEERNEQGHVTRGERRLTYERAVFWQYCGRSHAVESLRDGPWIITKGGDRVVNEQFWLHWY